jgi:hypothetical protein
MRSQSARRARRVENGIAVLEACAQTKKLRMNVKAKTRPGTSVAVYGTVSLKRTGSPIASETHHKHILAPILSTESFVYSSRVVA